MNYREQRLGKPVMFLLPSLKLKDQASGGASPESRLHDFLIKQFGGYTAQTGNIFGYWTDESGTIEYGEHREFTVSLTDDRSAATLKDFLAGLALELGETCIYLRIAGETALLYPAEA